MYIYLYIFTYARTDDTFIVVWIYTNTVLFQLKGKLTEFAMLQLVLMQVRPTPNPCIHHMRKSFATCNLFKHKTLLQREKLPQRVVEEGNFWPPNNTQNHSTETMKLLILLVQYLENCAQIFQKY